MDNVGNEVTRVKMNAAGIFASDKYFPGTVYKIYIVFVFRPRETNPINLLMNQDGIFSSIKICFDIDNDPARVVTDKYIFEFSPIEEVLDMFTVPGMPASYSYIEFNVDFNVHSKLFNICNRFLRKKITMYTHHSKMNRFLYSWCVVKAALPTEEKMDWTETEWMAFALSESGIIPKLHATYISQRELFLLCYNAPIKTRNARVTRMLHVDRDAYLSELYSSVYGINPSAEEVNVNNCLAIYLYQQMQVSSESS